MVTRRQLSDTEWLLLTTPDDTEEAPWMVVPEFQWRVVALLMSALRLYVRRRGLTWHLAAELKITMPRRIIPRSLDLAPDLMVVEADDAPRTSWDVRVEGQVPPFVLEVVTKDSWERDTVEKPLLYDAMGVQEYVIFAPQRKDGGPLLFGYHRDAEGRFVPWHTDEQGALHSAVLGGLTLYVEDGEWLRLRDAQGQRLPSAEEEAERAEREAERAEREAERAEQEAAARQAAEAELERLRALLRQQDTS
jgi:Uma2 family endonuclease